MTILHASLYSDALKRTVPITAVLPVDKVDASGKRIAPPPYKTLYLLHGIFGDETDWISGTRIARWAMDHDLAVIMPAGDNHFYIDQPGEGYEYGRFISQELVELTRLLFPLSHQKEETFIGGLSMGGWGALINALRHPETFGGVIALSPAILLENWFAGDDRDADILFRHSFQQACTGLSSWKEAQKKGLDLEKWIQDCGRHKTAPRIFLACGLDDPFLASAQWLKQQFEENGCDLTWNELPGGHDWDFWDMEILRALDWIGTPPRPGISSGNVFERH